MDQHNSLLSPSCTSFDTSRGVFVTGTDTNIGKTFISALLCRAWNAAYWKPLQTGLADDPGDTTTVQHLAQLPPDRIIPPAYSFQAPLAPEAAAKHEHLSIDPTRFTLPSTPYPLVIEGAGGLMVPITRTMLMIDLIKQLNLPTILVTRSGLGTLNHTLLSLEALYRRNIPVAGFISNGAPNPENQKSLEKLGKTRCILSVPHIPSPSPKEIETFARNVPMLKRL